MAIWRGTSPKWPCNDRPLAPLRSQFGVLFTAFGPLPSVWLWFPHAQNAGHSGISTIPKPWTTYAVVWLS